MLLLASLLLVVVCCSVDRCCRVRLFVAVLCIGERVLVVVCLLLRAPSVDVCCCGMCSMMPLCVVYC